MYIIAGLGNPGKRYENTRHNIGFIALDLLAERNDIKINKIKHKALVGEGRISGQKVLLVKPQTFMNLSGQSLREVMDYYREEPEHLVVIYDDIDIPTGTIRIRKKGSAGTHNGMRSIVGDLKSDQFPRIRIGMGSSQKGDLRNFVIGGFSKEEKEPLEEAVRRAVLAAECIVEKGIDKAMNEYNIRQKAAGEDNDKKGND
ncbi:aminoacyl-tRNA hydrolase [Anaerovorax odorimutans]|uniref:Peptidyl-tRNA hydrolase n=1 Tax=Anaerovorax odorimutans TaxID=109327 RepID=A0ABT1RPD7_9FIRM|nr:aminoacyl-tRNA hydrolase [Anaerovorax odorimutans]MCQ4637064.1 aminoacyl-tRNA hydrolase [Anaerovorax odorimutans]